MSHLSERPEQAVVGLPLPHESAALHVTGEALYTDDLVVRTRDILHAWPVQSPHAHARILSLRVKPAYDVPGVVRVLTAEDVPGVNDAGVKHDEPLFPTEEAMFHGHAICWVLGETLEAARLGAAAVEVEYEELPSLITVREAIAAGNFQGAGRHLDFGDVETALSEARPRLPGRVRVRRVRSTSTSRPTPRWRWSTRAARSSCRAAPSIRRRRRRSSPTSSAWPATP